MKFIFIIIFYYLTCMIPSITQKSEIEPDIYSCFMDPEVNELMQHSIQLKNYKEANEILLNLLTIRPNCFDLHQVIAGNYAFLNDMTNFQKYNNKAKFLQTEYDIKSGKFNSRIEKKLSDASKPRIIYTEPPSNNRLDYWRWKYIYRNRRY